MPRLYNLNVAFGANWSQKAQKTPWQISSSRTDFAHPVVSHHQLQESIDPLTIYFQWNASAARTIMTGHYLAARHKGLFDSWSRVGNSKSELKKATNRFWDSLSSNLGGITRLTIYINEELQAWGNSFSSSLLAQPMDVGPRTIHTRLYEARKFGYLHAVGSGNKLFQ